MISRTSRLFAWVASALFAVAAVGCSTATGSKVGQTVDDATISTKVKTALLADPDVSGTAIQVETMRGTVQLSGFVDSAAQAKRATDIAGRVEGVKDVQNKMSVTKK